MFEGYRDETGQSYSDSWVHQGGFKRDGVMTNWERDLIAYEVNKKYGTNNTHSVC